MSLILDSGALIALDRNDRAMWRRLKLALEAGDALRSHGGVVAQVWRGPGPRQARLAAALRAIDVQPLDEALGRTTGELLARSRSRDVIDAALVRLAEDGDQVITSDPDDLAPLAAAAGLHVDLVRA